MKTEFIRAFLLEKGDRFLWLGLEYQVTAITDTTIYTNAAKHHLKIGRNSRQKIELICNPTVRIYLSQ